MRYFFVVCAVIIVCVGGWLYAKTRGQTETPTPTPSATPTSSPTPLPSVPRTPVPTPTPGLIINETKIYEVTIQDFAFNPATTTVRRGDIVVFKNMDSEKHTVTSDTGVFDSTIDQGQQWTLETANMAPGTYQFHCSIHTAMKGTIIIQ